MYSEKLLIFHTNSRYLEKISTYLKNSGFSIILASDRDTAYQLTVSMNPKLILWGENLTIKNKDIIEKIKTSPYGTDIPIIALDKGLELFEKIEAQKYGVDDFFSDDGDYSDLKSKIKIHLGLKEQINFMRNQVNHYRDFSNVSIKMVTSREITEICDSVMDYLLKSYSFDFLILNIYNAAILQFDYFRVENFSKKLAVTLDEIKDNSIWKTHYFSDINVNSEGITDKNILTQLDQWNLNFKHVFQFPIASQGKVHGVILLSFKNDEFIDQKDTEHLNLLIKALCMRVIEIRRLFGTSRGINNQLMVSRDLFHRLTEEEITVHVTKNLIEFLHADIGMYISYNEGFRFLFPKYLFKSKSDKNVFHDDKPPVLLLGDFPSFERLLIEKKTFIFNSKELKLGEDLKSLPGIKQVELENIIIFPVILERSIQGFIVIGSRDSYKNFTYKESHEGEQLIKQATEVLLENRILKKAKQTIKQLDRIFDLGTELTLDLPIKDILKKICTAIRRTLGWNVVILDIKDKYEDKFKMISLLGLKDADHQRYIKSKQYPIFESRLDKSFKISNSYFYNHSLSMRGDVDNARDDFLMQIGSEWNDKDWLYVPIESRGELLGMISLNDPVDRVKPAEDRVKSVEYFANQAAVAMDNTQLFESLKYSELRYRLLAETMTLGLVTCKFDGEIVYVNQSLLKTLQYELESDLLGESIYKICSPPTVKNIQNVANEIMENEKLYEDENLGFEIELISHDKEPIPFHIFVSPYYERNIKIGFFAVLSDLRNQKKLERMKSDFNSMIVHDLRSPLNIIQGYVDIVRTQVIGKITEEQADLLTIAKENVYKVLKLIDNFMIASKLEVGKFTIEPEINSINSLIETLFEHYMILANKKSINFEMKLDQNLPLLNFDKFRIEQVLTNYLSNALKFTPENGRIEISSKLIQVKHKVTGEVKLFAKVTVGDSGVGIASDEIDKVFNKYEQTQAGKNASLKGTGLGLAISREIIQLHDGEVGVQSKVNQGSTFYFTLPINPVII